MRKSFLIVGASGELGGNLMKELKKKFVVFGTYKTYKKKNLLKLDINNKGEIKEIVKKTKPSHVFILSSKTNVAKCEIEKDETYRINVEGIKNLISCCNKNEKIIFLSTDAVFDGKKKEYFEEDEKNPVNIYGKTKSIAEDLILKRGESLVIRTSRLFGIEGKKFVNVMIDHLSRGLKIEVPKGNKGTPTFIPSLSKAIIQLVERDVSGIYHAVGEGNYSLIETAKIICSILNFDESNILIKEENFFNEGVARPSVVLNAIKLNKEGIFVEGLIKGLNKIKDGRRRAKIPSCR